MANIFDYIAWRGDLSFQQSALNEVDSLIFSRFAYLPLDGIVSNSLDPRMTIAEAADRFYSDTEDIEKKVLGKEDLELFRLLAESERFGSLPVFAYVNQIDHDEQKQFSCVTVELSKDLFFIAFRGTDDTLVGWKEDFNLSFLHTIPAQTDALCYLERMASSMVGDIYLGGHSKGGNLAVYAAILCSEMTKERIKGVYCNDAPGFQSHILADPRYNQVRDRIHTYVPQSSVVGMLLEHEEAYEIVHSTEMGFFQHDLYSWEIMRTHFVCLETVTSSSQFLNQTINDWLGQLDTDKRELFFNTLYGILTATDANTLLEMNENRLHKARMVIDAFRHVDEPTKHLLSKTVSELLTAARKNLRLLRNQKEKDTDVALQ